MIYKIIFSKFHNGKIRNQTQPTLAGREGCAEVNLIICPDLPTPLHGHFELYFAVDILLSSKSLQ